MGGLSDNFNLEHFLCPCEKCPHPLTVSTALILKLQAIRDVLGVPLKITSGLRCEKHNKKIGGEKDSAHLTGEAADILTPNDKFRWYFLDEAMAHFRRIGMYTKHIHVDVSETLPSPRLWVDVSR